MLKGTDEWFKSTQAGQINKGKSNGSFLSTCSAIGAHSLEIVTHHARLQILVRKGNSRDRKGGKMTELERKKMFNLTDTIQGEINRMCVTKDLAELDTMALHARINISKLRDMRFNADFRVEDKA